MTHEIVFATNNAHKLEELRRIAGNRLIVHSLAEIGCHDDIPETADTLEGNATIKAQWVKERYGYDCFADDTGLEVEALGGEPGVRSARYAGDGHDAAANTALLLQRLQGIDNRRARFRTVIALAIGQQPIELMDGVVNGTIATSPAGDGGFGYDPVFVPDDANGLTFAQMDADAKNAISHRGRATARLMQRLSSILAILILALCGLPSTTIAQTLVGSWEQIPAFGGTPQKVVATDSRVYYVSGGYLGSVETDGGDIRTYSTSDLLSDSQVTNIYYNYDRNFAIVVYSGGNMDMVYANDRSYNLADISNAQLTVDKTINDIAFNGDRMYVATNFGLVEFDTNRRCVVWSMILDHEVEAVAVVGDKLIISYQSGIYTSPISDRHNTLSRFTQIGGGALHYIIPVSDTKAIALNGTMTGPWSLVSMTFNDDKSAFDLQFLGPDNVIALSRRKGGGAVAMEPGRILYVDADGSYNAVTLPSSLDGCSSGSMTNGLATSYIGPTDVWTATANGISHYSLGADGTATPTLLTGPARPVSTTSSAIGYIVKGAASGNLYIGSMGTSNIYGFYENQQSHIDLSTGPGNYTEITPSPTFWTGQYPARNGLCYGNKDIAENPNDPNLLYVGNFWEGIYRIDLSGKMPLMSYNWTNSPFVYYVNWACLVPALGFDPVGNLWAFEYGTNTMNMLPAAKTTAATVEASDWKSISIPSFDAEKDSRMLISSRSNAVVMTSMLADQVLVVDTRGTWNDTSDDRYTVRETMTDQDGLQFVPGSPVALAEDLNGHIWVGHGTGVYEITDVTKFHNSDFTVNRLKVPRNDGTNNADYLLNGLWVTSIAVDGSNRKWLGTTTSGVYLVSADGSSVIEHYTTDNSALPSNCIYTIYCDDSSNLVYVGTSVGLMIYSSDSTPAAADYSNVYAYPNPVRPDYTGWITVTGLMDNSLVKIADAAGNVFFNGRSNGGMITWDGCDTSGQRVRTGVYFVFASESPSGSGSGAVAKILVVN
jgi:non-canonical purine NTP pyrophosphatase (RdgB/HAM1 family)